IDRLLEAAVGAVLSGDLVKRLLAGRHVEPLGEGLVLAALVAVPHLGGEVAVHQPADVERQRFQWVGGRLRLRLRLWTRSRGLAAATTAGIGAAEQIRQ